jgi:glutaminyl-peptide cyclotransferase
MTRMKRSFGVMVGAALLVMVAGSAPAQNQASFVLVETFPHDSGAFTQGFDFVGRKLYEGTGQYGESDLRRVVLATGKIKRKIEKNEKYFGEGVTVFKNRIYQLTWRENVTFVYSLDTWRVVKKLSYEGEGWGLTHDRRHLVMSNGSNEIVFRDPVDFEVKRRIEVTDRDGDVTGLNELEWVKGQILANVWPTDRIVRIDPTTGEVTGSYDMSSLRAMESREADVTNGIAYMSRSDRLFVTGKYWAHVYEVILRD